MEAVAQADVTLDKVLVTPDPVARQPVTYELRVTNNGPQLASAVVLVNQLPPHLDATDDSADLGTPQTQPNSALQLPPSCLLDGTTATCQLGDLTAGTSRTLTLGGIVRQSTPAGTTLLDTATVSYDGVDSVRANNTDTDTILVLDSSPSTTIDPTTTILQPPPTVPSSGPLPATATAISGLLAAAAMLLGSGIIVRRARRQPPQTRDT